MSLFSECPPDFVLHNNSCYGFMAQAKSWTEAKAHCINISNGSNLVVIQDQQENEFLQNYIQSNFNNQEFWIGLRENGITKQYVWVDGSPFEFGNELGKGPWMGNEPNTVKIDIGTKDTFNQFFEFS